MHVLCRLPSHLGLDVQVRVHDGPELLQVVVHRGVDRSVVVGLNMLYTTMLKLTVRSVLQWAEVLLENLDQLVRCVLVHLEGHNPLDHQHAY